MDRAMSIVKNNRGVKNFSGFDASPQDQGVCGGRRKYIPVGFAFDIHVSHARRTPPDPAATQIVPDSGRDCFTRDWTAVKLRSLA